VHDVGLEAALDRATLVTRGAVRRLERDALPVEVFCQSAVTVLLACSRMEKPTRLSDSDELSLAPAELPPHPARAMTPTADAATAAFHFALTEMVLLVLLVMV